jgi:hypothetical protein
MKLGISQYEQIAHDRLRQIGLVIFVRRGVLIQNVITTTCATGLANVYGKKHRKLFSFSIWEMFFGFSTKPTIKIQNF